MEVNETSNFIIANYRKLRNEMYALKHSVTQIPVFKISRRKHGFILINRFLYENAFQGGSDI